MRLLESQAGPERRGGGTTLSVVAHAAIIVAAAMASARTPRTVRTVEIVPGVVYHAQLPPEARERPASDGGATGTTASGPTRTIDAPRTIPGDLPPVDVGDVPVQVGPRTDAAFDGTRGGATEGGFGGGAPYGAVDASGAWDAHAVEVPVAPDARNPVPAYPEMLRTAGMTGRVVAEFIVDTTGRVRPGSLAIVEATHELFAMSVRRTVPAFRFTPARVRGQRVAQRVRVPFEFEMR